VLKGLQSVMDEKMAPERTFGSRRQPDGTRRPLTVVGDLHLNLLVAFGLSFFLGPLGSPARENEESHPQFFHRAEHLRQGRQAVFHERPSGADVSAYDGRRRRSRLGDSRSYRQKWRGCAVRR